MSFEEPLTIYKLFRATLNAAGIPAEALHYLHELVDSGFLSASAQLYENRNIARAEIMTAQMTSGASETRCIVQWLLLTTATELGKFAANAEGLEKKRAMLEKLGQTTADDALVQERAEFLDHTIRRAARIVINQEEMGYIRDAIESRPTPSVEPTPVTNWTDAERYFAVVTDAWGPSIPLYIPVGNYELDGPALEPTGLSDLVYRTITGICGAPTMFGAHLVVMMGLPAPEIFDTIRKPEEFDVDNCNGIILISAVKARPHWTAAAYAAIVLQSLFGAMAAGFLKEIQRFAMLGPTMAVTPEPGDFRKHGDIEWFTDPEQVLKNTQQYAVSMFAPGTAPVHQVSQLEHTLDGIVPSRLVTDTRHSGGQVTIALEHGNLFDMLKLDEIGRKVLYKDMQRLGVMGTIPVHNLCVAGDSDAFWPNMPKAIAKYKARQAAEAKAKKGDSNH